MNLAELLGKKHKEQTENETPRVSKEEYAAQKKAEREAVWERVDAQTARVFRMIPPCGVFSILWLAVRRRAPGTS